VGSPEAIAVEFSQTLPKRYAKKFSTVMIAGHAAIAADRGSAPANVGPVHAGDPSVLGMCVVALDRAGLLATISAAFHRSGWDVMAADAFTRKLPTGEHEAVDLFWLTRHSGAQSPLEQREIEQVRGALLELLGAHTLVPRITRSRAPRGSTHVRFLENSSGKLCTLELETADASGLLGVITAALFAQNVRITSCRLTTTAGRVFDRFTITELDGSPIGPPRRLEIQVAVISALEFPSIAPPAVQSTDSAT
jgi:[protein-PII] uridylyltransferase